MESEESELTINDIQNKIDKGLIWERKDKKFRKDKGGEYKTRDRKEWERSNFVKTYLAVFFHPDGFTQTDIAKAGILFQKDKRGEYLPYSESSKGAVIRALIEELVEEKWIKPKDVDEKRERKDDRKKVYVINEEKEILTQFMQKYTLNELQLSYVKQELNKLRANNKIIEVIMNELRETLILELEDIAESLVYYILDPPIDIFQTTTSKITFLKEDIDSFIWDKITNYRKSVMYPQLYFNDGFMCVTKAGFVFQNKKYSLQSIRFFEYPFYFKVSDNNKTTCFGYIRKIYENTYHTLLKNLNKDPFSSYPKLFKFVLEDGIEYIKNTENHFIKEMNPNWENDIKGEGEAVKEEEVDKIKRNIKECNFWFRWYIDYILIYLFSYGKTGIKNQKSEILGNYVKWEDKRVYDGEIYSPTFKIMDIVPDRFHHDIEHKKENIRNELDHQIKQEYINAMRKGLNEFLFEIGLYHICDRDYLKEKLNKWEDRCSFEVEIGNRRPSLTIPIKFFEINKGNLFLSLEDLGIGKEEIDDDIYDLWFVQDFSLFDKIPKTNEDFRERYIQKYTEAVKEFYNYSKEKGWEWVKYYGESDPEKIKSDLEKEYYYKAPISDEYMNYLSQEIKKLSTPSVFPALKDLTVNMKKLMNTESENEFKNIFIELFIDRLLLSGTEPEFTYFL